MGDLVSMRVNNGPVRLKFDKKKFPPKTEQHHAAGCDINNIMAKFKAHGVLTHLNKFGGRYGDFTNAPASYQEAMDIVERANAMFLSLPAEIRARFEHDPGAFIDWVEDPANREELSRLGLARAHIDEQKGAAATVEPSERSGEGSAAPEDASGEA